MTRFSCVDKDHENDLIFEADDENYKYTKIEISSGEKKKKKGFDLESIVVSDTGSFI